MAQKLTSTDVVVDADKQVLFAAVEQDYRGAPMTALVTYLQGRLNFGITLTDYSSPSATGFSVSIRTTTSSVWLVLTPTATFATGTIVLPTTPVDRQEVLVNCTQIVTALTVDGGTATVTGEPTALAANDFFRLRYDSVSNVWYRVG